MHKILSKNHNSMLIMQQMYIRKIRNIMWKSLEHSLDNSLRKSLNTHMADTVKNNLT